MSSFSSNTGGGGEAKRRGQRFAFFEEDDFSLEEAGTDGRVDGNDEKESHINKLFKRKATGICTFVDEERRKRRKQTNLLSFATSIKIKKKDICNNTPKTESVRRGNKVGRSGKQKGTAIQTFLDLGQKGFDLTTCPICKMMYTPGIDEKTHKAVCASLKKASSIGRA